VGRGGLHHQSADGHGVGRGLAALPGGALHAAVRRPWRPGQARCGPHHPRICKARTTGDRAAAESGARRSGGGLGLNRSHFRRESMLARAAASRLAVSWITKREEDASPTLGEHLEAVRVAAAGCSPPRWPGGWCAGLTARGVRRGGEAETYAFGSELLSRHHATLLRGLRMPAQLDGFMVSADAPLLTHLALGGPGSGVYYHRHEATLSAVFFGDKVSHIFRPARRLYDATKDFGLFRNQALAVLPGPADRPQRDRRRPYPLPPRGRHLAQALGGECSRRGLLLPSDYDCSTPATRRGWRRLTCARRGRRPCDRCGSAPTQKREVCGLPKRSGNAQPSPPWASAWQSSASSLKIFKCLTSDCVPPPGRDDRVH
jgi:hypothetical protein